MSVSRRRLVDHIEIDAMKFRRGIYRSPVAGVPPTVVIRLPGGVKVADAKDSLLLKHIALVFADEVEIDSYIARPVSTLAELFHNPFIQPLAAPGAISFYCYVKPAVEWPSLLVVDYPETLRFEMLKADKNGLQRGSVTYELFETDKHVNEYATAFAGRIKAREVNVMAPSLVDR